MKSSGSTVVVVTWAGEGGYGFTLGLDELDARNTLVYRMYMSSVKGCRSGLKSNENQAQKERNRKSSLMQSTKQDAVEPSLVALTKRLPTSAVYKGYEIRVMNKRNYEPGGVRGWIAVAKKGNVYVVGADSSGRLVTNASEQAAMSYICSLIDFDTANQNQLSPGTIERLYNE
jgi:hypothetical protein